MQYTYRKILKSLLYIPLLCTLFSFALFLYIYTGIRNIPMLSRYISSYISKQLEFVQLNINSVNISWNKQESELYAEFQQVHCAFGEKSEVFVPSIGLSLDILGFLGSFGTANNFVKSIDISGEIGFKFEDVLHTHPKHITNFQHLIGHNASAAFQKIGNISEEVSDALNGIEIKFTLKQGAQPLSLVLNKIVIEPITYNGLTSLQLYLDGHIANDHVILSAYLDTSRLNALYVRGEFKNISPHMIAHVIFPKEIAEEMKYYFDGIFNFIIDDNYGLDTIQFSIVNFPRFLKKGLIFEQDIKVEDFAMSARCSGNYTDILIDQFMIKAGDLNLNGTFNKSSNDVIVGSIQINDLEVSKLYQYWPKPAVGIVRDWLQQHLKNGLVKNARVEFFFDLPQLLSGVISKDTVIATFDLNDAKLKYMEQIPELSLANSRVIISANDVEVKSEEVSFLGSKVKDLIATINYFPKQVPAENLQPTKDTNQQYNGVGLTISAKVSGPLQNLINIGFLHAGKQNEKLIGYKGNSEVNLKFFVPFDDEVSLDTMHMQIVGKSFNTSTPKVAGNYHLSAKEVNLSFISRALDINAPSAIINNTLPAAVNVKYLVTDDLDISIQCTSSANVHTFRQANIYVPDFISGTVKINASGTIKANDALYNIGIDLQNSHIDLGIIGLYKSIGVYGQMNVTAKNQPTTKSLFDIKYQLALPDLQSEGDGIISEDLTSSIVIKSQNLLLRGHSMSFHYDASTKAEKLHLKGNVLDLSTANFTKVDNVTKNSRTKIFELTTDFKKVILKSGVELIAPTIFMSCTLEMCNDFHVRGSFAKTGYVNIFYRYPTIAVISNDAGSILKAFGIYDRISNGSLEFKAELLNNQSLQGKFLIEKFHVSNTPLLAKFLSMVAVTSASFKGLGDFVSGKGMGFDKLSCDLEYEFPAIYFKECRVSGPILRVKGSSVINHKTKLIKAAGVLVPTNIVNTVIQSIPIIGNLVSGGKDNGVISTNFYVSGNLDKEVQITINPLSLLTPGFLGEIFNQESSILRK